MVAPVISRAIRSTRLGNDVADALGGHELPVLAERIMQRAIYLSTPSRRTSVLDEFPKRDTAALR